MALLLVVIAFLLVQDGIKAPDLGVIVIAGGLAFIVWRALQTRQAGPNSPQAIRELLRDGTKPTLIQFYSEYCAACVMMKPVMEQLEMEAGSRMRIIRLNIETEPGKTLKDEFGVAFTPTFFYFDRHGNRVRESVFILDKAKILYELERA